MFGSGLHPGIVEDRQSTVVYSWELEAGYGQVSHTARVGLGGAIPLDSMSRPDAQNRCASIYYRITRCNLSSFTWPQTQVETLGFAADEKPKLFKAHLYLKYWGSFPSGHH